MTISLWLLLSWANVSSWHRHGLLCCQVSCVNTWKYHDFDTVKCTLYINGIRVGDNVTEFCILDFHLKREGCWSLTIIVDLPIPPLSSPHLCVDCQLFWLWHRWSCYGILLEGSLILHNVFPHLLVIAFSLMFASSYTIISTLSLLCLKFMLHILWNLFTATHLYHYIWYE